MKKIDVIIPTIMCTDPTTLGYTLIQLNECPMVNKIIVIDNTRDFEFTTKMGVLANQILIPKLSIHDGFKYKFLVNGAWNYGMEYAKLSEGDVPYWCLLNDDILAHRYVFESVWHAFESHKDLSLLTVDTVDGMPLDEYVKNYDTKRDKLTEDIPNGRQGWIMFGKKDQWSPIPGGLRLFYGDDWIYRECRKAGRVAMITGPRVSHFQSSSVNTNMDKLRPVIEEDEKVWRRINS
jgi:hypothetical protein